VSATDRARDPLVESSTPLTDEERARYARQLALPGFGEQAQRRLAAARVLVIGAGGLGTPVLAALAAAGVGTAGAIGVVDDDTVETSNLHRQLLHRAVDVGRPKTASAAAAMREINPAVRVHEHRERLTADNAVRLLRGYDLVIDGSDNFDTRYLVCDTAGMLGIPTVWGAVLGFTGQVSVFWPPHGPSYRDLHPDAPSGAATCATGGVLGMVCHAVGAVMAAEAVKLVTGVGRTLFGRLLLCDALDMTWRTVTLTRDPGGVAAPGGIAGPASVADPLGLICGPFPDPTALPAVLTPSTLARELAETDGLVVIDVRDAEETAGILPGSHRVPLSLLAEAPEIDTIDPSRPVVTVCASGVRAARAAAQLAARGFRDVRSLAGAVTAVHPAADPGV